MLDLFSLPYPATPGFKSNGTSSEAAAKSAQSAEYLRARVLAYLENIAPFGCTADELAEKIGCSILACRPRVSELNARGLIEKTGERRKNASGMSASVWRAR